MTKQNILSKILFLFSIIFFSLSSLAESLFEKKDIVVAIIDTGIDTKHPMFRDHLWVNQKEKSNGQDDDGNGYADDLHGWNFISNKGDVADNHGHGTHVAGIILQKAPSERVKFMILKYYDPYSSNEDNLLSTVKAIRYAIEMKADIINYSGGGNSRSPMEEAAIKDAQKKGILFIAAAGNDGRNTDVAGFYPAGYRLSNIISVAAIDSNKRLLASSNYGSHTVDIAAPGKDIYSSLPGGHFGPMTGTSQATAWVSGLAVSLLLKVNKSWTPENLKKLLLKVAIKDQGLSNKIKTASRISNLQALNMDVQSSH